MIARVWSGRSAPEKAADYVRHLETSVFPELRAIDGHAGAYVLRRDAAGREVEFLVITLWTSMSAIRKFAGDDAETAVVEPQAKALLTSFDSTVKHYEVAVDTAEVSKQSGNAP